MRHVLLLLLLSARGFDFEDEEEPAAGAGESAWLGGDEDAGASSVLMHTVGGATPAARGTLVFKAPKGGGKVAVRVTQARLEGEELDAVRALAKAGGVYSISLPSVLSDPESPPIYASTSACSLLASRFEEHLELTMSSKDRVLALSYYLPVVPPTCPTDSLPRLALDEVLFNTSATQVFPGEGPRPLGKIHDASFLPPAAAAAAQRAAAGAAGAEGKDGAAAGGAPENQSFLRKYWMYILPVVLVLSMGGGEEPPGQGGGGATRPAAGAPRVKR